MHYNVIVFKLSTISMVYPIQSYIVTLLLFIFLAHLMNGTPLFDISLSAMTAAVHLLIAVAVRFVMQKRKERKRRKKEKKKKRKKKEKREKEKERKKTNPIPLFDPKIRQYGHDFLSSQPGVELKKKEVHH